MQSAKSWRVLLGHLTPDASHVEWSALHAGLATGSEARLGVLGQGGSGSLGYPGSGRSSVVVC